MNKKKMVAEVIVIPLCIVWLLFVLLKSSVAALIIFILFSIVAAVWFSPKYFSEVYTYENKNNFWKLSIAIVDILLVIVAIVNLFLKLKALKIALIVLAILSFIHLVYFFVNNLKIIIKSKKDYGINVLYAFGSFLIFAIMVSTIIIYLK